MLLGDRPICERTFKDARRLASSAFFRASAADVLVVTPTIILARSSACRTTVMGSIAARLGSDSFTALT